MVKDPKVEAGVVENYTLQWLQLRALRSFTTDPKLFPGFEPALLEDMLTESRLVFAHALRENESLEGFLDADFTYVNERLAKHYGIEGVSGEEFRRVALPGDSTRGGVLTQASVLTVTSNPARTSPVKRGKWILEAVLGAPPPPPPPNVPVLEESEEAVLSGSLRERLEQHRADPACAVCHNKMDALGFAFENFNPVGSWREKDGSFDIDPSGTLPSGESFQGVRELKAILKGQQSAFTRAFSEKLLTYALGRGLEPSDRCVVDAIAATAESDGHRIGRVVSEIVLSPSFRKTRVEPVGSAIQ